MPALCRALCAHDPEMNAPQSPSRRGGKKGPPFSGHVSYSRQSLHSNLSSPLRGLCGERLTLARLGAGLVPARDKLPASVILPVALTSPRASTPAGRAATGEGPTLPLPLLVCWSFCHIATAAPVETLKDSRVSSVGWRPGWDGPGVFP